MSISSDFLFVQVMRMTQFNMLHGTFVHVK